MPNVSISDRVSLCVWCVCGCVCVDEIHYWGMKPSKVLVNTMVCGDTNADPRLAVGNKKGGVGGREGCVWGWRMVADCAVLCTSCYYLQGHNCIMLQSVY